ncbi:22258_t:CDS:2, partial [Racocetra persica]
VIKQNIKDTLKSTLDKLHSICLLNISRFSLCDSLHNNLYHDEAFCQNLAHTKIFNWFEASSQKTRQQDSSSATINNYNNNSNKCTCEVSPPVKQVFSFTASEQEAVIEPLLNLVKKTIYKFLVDSERFIPLDVVKSFCAKQHPPISTDFGDVDLLCMINFIIDNIKLFLKQKEPLFYGRYKANPVELLSNFKKNMSCEVVICLGGNCKEASSNKENIDNEITEFILDILKETKELEKEDKQKILRLALNEDEYLIKL